MHATITLLESTSRSPHTLVTFIAQKDLSRIPESLRLPLEGSSPESCPLEEKKVQNINRAVATDLLFFLQHSLFPGHLR